MRFGAPSGSAVLTEDDVNDWTPYTPPPAVTVEGNVSTSSGGGSSSGGGFLDTLFGTKQTDRGLVGSLVDIFGRLVGPTGQPLPPTPPPSSTPIWIYLAIPVVLIGAIALMRRRPSPSVAGYRRRNRRSRRSRR